MKYDVISIGGATEDVSMHTEEGTIIDNKNDVLRQKLLAFEYGAKIKVDQSNASFGGGAANVAVAVCLLGLKSAALVAVGDDTRGLSIIKNLKDNKVDVSIVQKFKGEHSGLSFLLVAQGNEHIVFSARGANSHLYISEKEIKYLRNAKWLYLTSLSGKWKSALKNIFENSSAKSKIAWNPGHIQLNSGIKAIGVYLKKTHILIINKDEAIELVVSDKRYKKKSLDFLNDTHSLLEVIKGFGPKIVVITNGQFGAYAFDGSNYYYQPVIKARKRVDTTGVGDAFGASFVSGLEIYKNNIKKALYLGARNTASCISVEGAQNGLLTKKDIKSI